MIRWQRIFVRRFPLTEVHYARKGGEQVKYIKRVGERTAVNGRRTLFHIPVQTPILNCFGNVLALDSILSGKVSNGAGYFQNASISTGAEAQFVDSSFEKLLGVVSDFAVFSKMPRRHLGIAVDGVV